MENDSSGVNCFTGRHWFAVGDRHRGLENVSPLGVMQKLEPAFDVRTAPVCGICTVESVVSIVMLVKPSIYLYRETRVTRPPVR